MGQHQQKQYFNQSSPTGVATVTAVVAGVVFLTGCQAMVGRAPAQAPMAASYEPDHTRDLNALQPAMGPSRAQATLQPGVMAPYAPPAFQQPYQGYGSPAFSALEGGQIELKQRLDRIEQALLRLDRRMQLVERNELGRMSGANPAPAILPVQENFSALPSMPLAQTVRQAMRAEEWGSEIMPQSLVQTSIPSMETPYAEGFAPVSQVDTTIRGTLQAAPRLPSLADPNSPNNGRIPQSAGNMAVWTVRYEPEKIWPDRTQLPASKGVVELLRNSQTVTLVARGPKPTSPAFQERVRALSRYLSKVASLETVPISTMATPQLDGDTIELLATP